MAVNLFKTGGGNNWGNTASWSLAAVPTAADGNVATFDATSPNCTVDTTARVCNNIDFTGYTNTITMTNTITVSGNCTFSSTMGVAGASALNLNGATGNLTSNGKTWPNPMNFNLATSTYTLLDNLTISGLLTLGAGTATLTLNGFQITATGSVTQGGSSGVVTGTTLLILAGTGNYTTASTTGSMRLSLTINTAGTITFVSAPNMLRYALGTLTYTAGTLVNVLPLVSNVTSSTTTFACSGITWPSIQFIGQTGTYTLSQNLTTTGLFTVGSGSSSITTVNGGTMTIAGGITWSTTSGNVTGTTVFILNGTGTLAAASITSARWTNPITINAPGGTITISSVFTADLGQILFTAGTVITTAGTWSSSGGASAYSFG